MMRGWRVSKYDPALRDARGAYVPDDWTSVSDIARAFPGGVLTREAYLRVEQGYVDVAMAFHAAAGSPPLFVRGLEAPDELRAALDTPPPALTEGEALGEDRLPAAIRAALREELWCRLAGADDTCHLHFGYDFYLYLVGTAPPESARAVAERRGLFFEPFRSPYLE